MNAKRKSTAWLRTVCSLILLFALTAGLPAQTKPRRHDSPRKPLASSYTNPVFDYDFPDPTVIRASDGWFYVYATQTILDGRMYNIQLARSLDLVNWTHMPDALPVKPVWAHKTQQFWAPDVHERGRTFYMYFASALNPELTEKFKEEHNAASSRENVSCLGVATSVAPGGPFTDSGAPLQCALSFVNIDPMAFDDPKTGKKYLYWGSGFHPIRVQELADDRMSFKAGSQPIELIKPDKSISYQNLVEGAWVVERDGYYYLFYSGENCCEGPPQQIKYAVMIARSRSATGPFETLGAATGKSDSVILKGNNVWLAPGHNSVVTDAAGDDWIAYHAIDSRHPYQIGEVGGERHVRRVMLIDRLVYRDGWPQIERGMPSVTRQPKLKPTKEK